MLTFKPKTNLDLCEKYHSDSTVNGYIAYENDGSECGFCAFRLGGYTMEILEVSVPDKDAETQEGLIRSALNYGANRNAYIAFYKAQEAKSVAEMLGFSGDDFSGEIPELLAGHCCKH